MRIAIVMMVVAGIFFAMKNSDSGMFDNVDFNMPSCGVGGHVKMHR